MLLAISGLRLGVSKMSTQKDVVNEVNAESALENAADISPTIKNTMTAVPNIPVAANDGRIWSEISGSST